MTLSTHYQQRLESTWVLIGGLCTSFLLLVYQIEHVFSKGALHVEQSTVGYALVLLLLGEHVAVFVATHCVFAFFGACIQSFFQTNALPPARSFLLNTLAYRLFYAPLSRQSIFFFGLFIGISFQNQVLLEKAAHANEWLIIGWFVLSMVQGLVLQFFIQSFIITLFYVCEALLGSHLSYVKRTTLQFLIRAFKQHGTHPANLVLSLVIAPGAFWFVLVASTYVGYAYTLNEFMTWGVGFALFVYIEVTLILTAMMGYQTKQKTKG